MANCELMMFMGVGKGNIFTRNQGGPANFPLNQVLDFWKYVSTMFIRFDTPLIPQNSLCLTL